MWGNPASVPLVLELWSCAAAAAAAVPSARLLGTGGGGEAALHQPPWLRLSACLCLSCSRENGLHTLILGNATCDVSEENVGHFTCSHLDTAQGIKRESKRPHGF